MNEQERFARHGGVHFIQRATPQEINRFVRNLPDEKRESLFAVLRELDHAGLITLLNDGVWADGEGQIGGSDEC